jgi:hypothetical protein
MINVYFHWAEITLWTLGWACLGGGCVAAALTPSRTPEGYYD